MSKQTSISLPASQVRTTRLTGNSRLNHGAWFTTFDFVPRYHYVSRFTPGNLVIDIAETIQPEKCEAEQQYAGDEKKLNARLTQELKERTAPTGTPGPWQAIDQKAAAVGRLLEEKRAALPSAWETAHTFYGEDPLKKTIADYAKVATRKNGFPDPKQAWLTSYKAAFEARLLAKSIDLLTARANKLAVERIKAQNRLHASADQHLDAQTQAVELAQAGLDEARFQHHVDLREMEERLQQFSLHQEETLTAETAPAHARDLAEEINGLLLARSAARSSRAAVNKQAQTLDIERNFLRKRLDSGNPEYASEQNRARREALVQTVADTLDAHQESWPEEQQHMASHEAQIEPALVDARNELVRLAALEGVEFPQRPATYNVSVSSMGLPQVITPKASSMAAFESVRPALGKALLSAGSRVGGVPRVGLWFAALVVFSLKLEEGGRHGLSVPLTSMRLDFDLQQLLDSIGEHFPLPMRLISGLAGDDSTIRIMPTGNERVPADVPVRAATWDADKGAYAFTTEGPGPITILWTPGAPPTDSSTRLPIGQRTASLYPGHIGLKNKPQFLPFPAEDDVHFDDYIITFPADSGLEPVYIMFKNPRDYAGGVAGSGQTIPGWRAAMDEAQGAPIPTQIADRLRGRTFSRWSKLKEAIWKAIANDPELSKQFNESDLDSMRRGNAAAAHKSDRVGSRKTFNIHHIHPVAQGGAVYDLDNLLIMTPKAHIDIHRKEID